MERESFADEEVARALTEAFVCIKVDREERPDVDNIYMSVCQTLTGRGGWPLNIVMTPEKKPFYAATYLPKSSGQRRPGLIDVAKSINETWKSNRVTLLDAADKVTRHVAKSMVGETSEKELQEEVFQHAYHVLLHAFDKEHGGFGPAPKFPLPHNLTFLLRYWRRTGEKQALQMVEKTLQALSGGGVYDHVGFGFHRYSTDKTWLLPHFEKMLYDQAQLAIAYLEAYRITQRAEYAQRAHEIFIYVLRDMTSQEGAFYSAEDADSEGEEGKFYVWSVAELNSILSNQDMKLVTRAFNVSEKGNYLEEATCQKTGYNILHMTRSWETLAEKFSLTVDELQQRWENIRQRLFAERQHKIHPYKDDKILTDWNGLMIAAFAIGGRVLNDKCYIDAARSAVGFILDRLRRQDGRLLKRYREGEGAFSAHVDDYAFLIWGLIELYEATYDLYYIQQALELNDTLLNDFWDEDNGGLFFTAQNNTDLPLRPKESYDGALPSGNSVAALNNLRLGRLTGNKQLEMRGEAILRAFSSDLYHYPVSHTQMLSALDFFLGPTQEIVVAGESDALDTQEMLSVVNTYRTPNTVVLFNNIGPGGNRGSAMSDIAPYTADMEMVEGKATAYICQDQTCQTPVTDLEEVKSILM